MQSPEEYVEGEKFDEKNIRRRVYDALNVLMAMNIIAKEKKARSAAQPPQPRRAAPGAALRALSAGRRRLRRRLGAHAAGRSRPGALVRRPERRRSRGRGCRR